MRFESQMIKFNQISEASKIAAENRRSGFKRVDDEYLIQLSQYIEQETKRVKEREFKQ